MANEEWGPLAGLIGEWQGEGGLDNAFSHSQGKVLDTTYLEKVTMKPFGPVDTGSQHLYGLDYRSAMWRGDEENPFHTEVGYWLWDGATGEVMEFTLRAEKRGENYNIGENQYLAKHASTVSYEARITIGDGEWSYHETATLKMDEFPDLFPYVHHNTSAAPDQSSPLSAAIARAIASRA